MAKAAASLPLSWEGLSPPIQVVGWGQEGRRAATHAPVQVSLRQGQHPGRACQMSVPGRVLSTSRGTGPFCRPSGQSWEKHCPSVSPPDLSEKNQLPSGQVWKRTAESNRAAWPSPAPRLRGFFWNRGRRPLFLSPHAFLPTPSPTPAPVGLAEVACLVDQW